MPPMMDPRRPFPETDGLGGVGFVLVSGFGAEPGGPGSPGRPDAGGPTVGLRLAAGRFCEEDISCSFVTPCPDVYPHSARLHGRRPRSTTGVGRRACAWRKSRDDTRAPRYGAGSGDEPIYRAGPIKKLFPTNALISPHPSARRCVVNCAPYFRSGHASQPLVSRASAR